MQACAEVAATVPSKIVEPVHSVAIAAEPYWTSIVVTLSAGSDSVEARRQEARPNDSYSRDWLH